MVSFTAFLLASSENTSENAKMMVKMCMQGMTKVVSNSARLVDFSVGLVDFLTTCPTEKGSSLTKFLERKKS